MAAWKTLTLGHHNSAPLADSSVSAAARSGGTAAEQAACRKSAKYDLFQPIAVETLGLLNESSIVFFSELGRKIASVSGDKSWAQLSFSVHFSHCSALQLHLVTQQLSELRRWATTPASVFNLFITLGIFTTKGIKILIICTFLCHRNVVTLEAAPVTD